VEALLDTALDPVLDRAEAEAEDPAEALLSLTVIDPACGSGHFLLGAAHRMAGRVARHRTDGNPSKAEYRHALRDIARRCLHGVDRNPMAVELTKVALWIETVDPGLPLGFFDAQIRCGDSLLGVFDLDALRRGVPDDAYKPLSGDDRETARQFLLKNREDKGDQGRLDFERGGGKLPERAPLQRRWADARAMPERTVAQIAEKARAVEKLRASPEWYDLELAADLYVAAFLTPKAGDPREARVPTTADVWGAMAGRQPEGRLTGAAVDRAEGRARLSLAA
jgi:Type I restriction-modification system methyltransferase subunit